MTSKRPPAHLKKGGRAFWRNLTAENRLDAAEYNTLDMLGRLIDAVDAIDAEMATMGVIVSGSEGQPATNPLLRERRETIKLIDQLTTALAIPVAGESHGQRRSGAAKAAAKTPKPPKSNAARISHLTQGGA